MAPPKTKEEALKQMRLMWFAYLSTMPLYIYAGTITSFVRLDFQNAGTILGVLGILDLLSFVWIRMNRLPRAIEAMHEHPDDIHAVRHWRSAWTVLLSMAEAQAIFAVYLQVTKDALKPALPFYAIGLLLTLSLWPRQIWSDRQPSERSSGRP